MRVGGDLDQPMVARDRCVANADLDLAESIIKAMTLQHLNFKYVLKMGNTCMNDKQTKNNYEQLHVQPSLKQ